MISKFEQITLFFEEADKHLANPVSLYLIGGGMMLYNKLKVATKDIDIIVETKKEFNDFETALKEMEFIRRIPTAEYKKIDISQILEKKDFRIDLFAKTVCKGFSLTESMKQRAVEVLRLKHISLNICSHEDVFMFKTFTERDGDIEDCISLAQKELEWSIILEELKSQIKLSGNPVWITFVGERLDLLEERGLTIPIMKEINTLRENYFDELEKRLNM